LPGVDLILLDWTRMGRGYCLAGVVAEGRSYRTVRPLLAKLRDTPVRNVPWSAYLLDGHLRWEVFEVAGPQPTPAEPPHVEDLWVRAMRSRRRLATPDERRAVLAATAPLAGEPLFGGPLTSGRAAAYLPPGTGCRSLATVRVPARDLAFSAVCRTGATECDFRVTLPLPDVGERQLPVKDHHLLRRAEQAAADLEGRLRFLQDAVAGLGDSVAVRVGLSRPFQGDPGRAVPGCWLMADGFFSGTDPQP
jgi:hypothetical protein